eukprot:RCo054916
MEFSEVSFLADCTRPGPSSATELGRYFPRAPRKVDLVLFQKADFNRLQQATNIVAFLLTTHLRQYHKFSFALEMRRYAYSVNAAVVIQRAYRAYVLQRNAALLRWFQQWKAFEAQAPRRRLSTELTPRSFSARVALDAGAAPVDSRPVPVGAPTPRGRALPTASCSTEDGTAAIWELFSGRRLSERTKLAIVVWRYRELTLTHLSSVASGPSTTNSRHPLSLPAEEFFRVSRSTKADWLALVNTEFQTEDQLTSRQRQYFELAEAFQRMLRLYGAGEGSVGSPRSLRCFGRSSTARWLLRARLWLALFRPSIPNVEPDPTSPQSVAVSPLDMDRAKSLPVMSSFDESSLSEVPTVHRTIILSPGRPRAVSRISTLRSGSLARSLEGTPVKKLSFSRRPPLGLSVEVPTVRVEGGPQSLPLPAIPRRTPRRSNLGLRQPSMSPRKSYEALLTHPPTCRCMICRGHDSSARAFATTPSAGTPPRNLGDSARRFSGSSEGVFSNTSCGYSSDNSATV